MIISIPLKDIMISPGKRFNPAEHTDQDVINRIKKLYGVIAKVMNIEVAGGMVHIEFRDATPEKFNEAMRKLRKGVKEAQKGQLIKALNHFKDVLAIIPENLGARRYDRIAGFFSSSLLEVAGEALERMTPEVGEICVRVVCNSCLNPLDALNLILRKTCKISIRREAVIDNR